MNIPFKKPIDVAKDSVEYEIARTFLEGKKAPDGKNTMLSRVDAGLNVLEKLSSWPATMRAFCLRPLLQDDYTFATNWKLVCKNGVQPRALVLAMEFRRAANAYLCNPSTDSWSDEQAKLAVGNIIPPVRYMLIAHKVVGYRDFLCKQTHTHARRAEVRAYFERWLRILDVKNIEEAISWTAR